jgi:hypothetical protein
MGEVEWQAYIKLIQYSRDLKEVKLKKEKKETKGNKKLKYENKIFIFSISSISIFKNSGALLNLISNNTSLSNKNYFSFMISFFWSEKYWL